VHFPAEVAEEVDFHHSFPHAGTMCTPEWSGLPACRDAGCGSYRADPTSFHKCTLAFLAMASFDHSTALCRRSFDPTEGHYSSAAGYCRPLAGFDPQQQLDWTHTGNPAYFSYTCYLGDLVALVARLPHWPGYACLVRPT